MIAKRESSIAFQTGEIGSMKLKNRLVRSATFEAMATKDGKVTDIQVELYRTLAQGGVGLIITGHASVHIGWSAGSHMTRISDDSFIPMIRKIARAVHRVGNDCKVVLQLTQFGRQCLETVEGRVAPSAVYDTLFQGTPREMTSEEINEIIECFSEAIRRAREAEFDGVQLHAAHGYLLSSYLLPHTNRRDDEYGGSTQKRASIMKEIHYRATRKVRDDFPILVKINTDDFFPGGIDSNSRRTGQDRVHSHRDQWRNLGGDYQKRRGARVEARIASRGEDRYKNQETGGIFLGKRQEDKEKSKYTDHPGRRDQVYQQN